MTIYPGGVISCVAYNPVMLWFILLVWRATGCLGCARTAQRRRELFFVWSFFYVRRELFRNKQHAATRQCLGSLLLARLMVGVQKNTSGCARTRRRKRRVKRATKDERCVVIATTSISAVRRIGRGCAARCATLSFIAGHQPLSLPRRRPSARTPRDTRVNMPNTTRCKYTFPSNIYTSYLVHT